MISSGSKCWTNWLPFEKKWSSAPSHRTRTTVREKKKKKLLRLKIFAFENETCKKNFFLGILERRSLPGEIKSTLQGCS